ncbi:MAG: HDOD domain-containing protein [Pseudomonadota bacterium]
MDAAQALSFLNTLAHELESGKVALPSFPDAVMKIRDALQQEDCEIPAIVKLVNLEPVLASRLMQAANSAFHNPSGRDIPDLNAAVMRLGLQEVRNRAIAFAVEQLFAAEKNASLADSLGILWRQSVAMAAAAATIAARFESIDPGKAYLAGLLHDIGKLYMLQKSVDFPAAVVDLGARCDDDSWHPQIGRSIAEQWGFTTEILDTMDAHEHIGDNPKQSPRLVDVVIAAERVVTQTDAIAHEDWAHISLQRLQLDADQYRDLQPVIEQRTEEELRALGRTG